MLAIAMALVRPALAYVDPGAGLLAFQIVGSTFAGIVFLVRSRLRRFFEAIVRRLCLRIEQKGK